MDEPGRTGGLHKNVVSYVGLILGVIGTLLTLFSIAVNLLTEQSSPYVGIVTFVLFPGVIVLGIGVFLLGLLVESLRRRRDASGKHTAYPFIDLNQERHRKLFAVVCVVGFFLLLLLGFAGYNAFMFTESNAFCGKVCHEVMKPEYDSFQHSSHARVRCVHCHVGSGASYYVKSKLNGITGMLTYLGGEYERPIPTPIKNLRPARETCEECHWPNKFFGAQLMQIPYYRFDESNTSDQISIVIKTGGGNAKMGQNAGIHWHMISENRITYVARDHKLQDIPWFKVVGPHGEVREYMNTENPVSTGELASLAIHTMDCMDCHNRPAHTFPAPDRAIDVAMHDGAIKTDLPWIKKVTTDALMAPYKDNDEATEAIRNTIFAYYSKNHPEVYRTRSVDISEAANTAIAIYNRTVFPTMKVDWNTYPENIGHRNWPGCFRCHDNKHATANGQVLSNKCSTCHSMPQRGRVEAFGNIPSGNEEEQANWHPFPLTGKHGSLLCHACHSAGIRPSSDCNSCHKHPAEAPMADMACRDCHTAAPEKLPIASCADCHSDRKGLHSLAAHTDATCNECHKPHNWKPDVAAACSACHGKGEKCDADKAGCLKCHSFTTDAAASKSAPATATPAEQTATVEEAKPAAE